MRRRDFIKVIAGSATAWPLAARAQQSIMPVVGFLNSASAWEYAHLAAAFRNGLNETGYVDGRNVVVDYRWAEGRYDRLPILADELVRRQAAVIAANTIAAPVAKATTASTPIVFYTGEDPVKTGLVASLNRPGANLTGVTSLSWDIAPKRLELLHELVPGAGSIGLLVNPANVNFEILVRGMQAGARTLGRRLDVLHASTERDFDPVFAKLLELHASGLVIVPDAFFLSEKGQLAALALRHKVPTIYPFREFTAAGGLMSYAPSLTDAYRQVGIYTGRVLKGEKPAELPVIQSTKFEFVINLKTAKALGLEISPKLLALADEVIE